MYEYKRVRQLSCTVGWTFCGGLLMRRLWMIPVLSLLVLTVAPAFACGCGSRWTITDIGWQRLYHFSFFAGLVLGTPLLLSRMSAMYRKDFPKLPRLNYFKSLLLVLGVGLLFQITIGLAMDTRLLTESPALRKAEANKATGIQLKIDQADLQQQDFNSVFNQLPKSTGR